MPKPIALITGASRGIGVASERLLARQGYDVCINYRRDADSAEQIKQQLEQQGARTCVVHADISSEQDVIRLFDEVNNKLGPVSHLVNNAGILFPQSRLEDVSVERLQKLFATNIIGTVLCCQQAVKTMSTKNDGTGGVIVNVSSVAAKLGSPHEYIDYAASKGAIDSLTIGLAAEVAEEGIRVNGVRPCIIQTTMHADGGEPGRVERVKQFVPLKRGGTPEEVASVIGFLLSEDSSYCTGSIIDVSGGR
jgi:NAD(P)-dependent dehydrogenase (short-subunit alcohol dehydrogenase family)